MNSILIIQLSNLVLIVRSYLSSDLKLTSLDRIKEEAEEEAIRRLLIRKQNLLAQLEHTQLTNVTTEVTETPEQVNIELTHDEENLLLLAEVEGSSLIYALIIFAEGLFPNGESHALHVCPPTSTVRMPLPVQRHLAVDLHINVLLESVNSDNVLKVIEIIHPLPTFSRLKSVPWPSGTNGFPITQYRVKTRLQERIQRVTLRKKFNRPHVSQHFPFIVCRLGFGLHRISSFRQNCCQAIRTLNWRSKFFHCEHLSELASLQMVFY